MDHRDYREYLRSPAAAQMEFFRPWNRWKAREEQIRFSPRKYPAHRFARRSIYLTIATGGRRAYQRFNCLVHTFSLKSRWHYLVTSVKLTLVLRVRLSVRRERLFIEYDIIERVWSDGEKIFDVLHCTLWWIARKSRLITVIDEFARVWSCRLNCDEFLKTCKIWNLSDIHFWDKCRKRNFYDLVNSCLK